MNQSYETVCLGCGADVVVPLIPERGMHYFVTVSCSFCKRKITMEVETIVSLYHTEDLEPERIEAEDELVARYYRGQIDNLGNPL